MVVHVGIQRSGGGRRATARRSRRCASPTRVAHLDGRAVWAGRDGVVACDGDGLASCLPGHGALSPGLRPVPRRDGRRAACRTGAASLRARRRALGRDLADRRARPGAHRGSAPFRRCHADGRPRAFGGSGALDQHPPARREAPNPRCAVGRRTAKATRRGAARKRPGRAASRPPRTARLACCSRIPCPRAIAAQAASVARGARAPSVNQGVPAGTHPCVRRTRTAAAWVIMGPHRLALPQKHCLPWPEYGVKYCGVERE